MDSVSVSFQYTAKAIDPKGLVQALAKLPGFRLRSDKLAVRGALTRGTSLQSGHAHLEALNLVKSRKIVVELELLSGTHGSPLEKSLSLEDAIEQVGKMLGEANAGSLALVSGNFTFDLNKWEPTIQLPFAPPGVTEKLPGLPQICGLDFAFSERDKNQPIHRAFVTTYPGANRMVVRLLLLMDLSLNRQLAQIVLDAVATQVAVFARERVGRQE